MKFFSALAILAATAFIAPEAKAYSSCNSYGGQTSCYDYSTGSSYNSSTYGGTTTFYGNDSNCNYYGGSCYTYGNYTSCSSY